MSDLVATVSEKMAGTPPELVIRSAQARAQVLGVSVDEILAAWAGDGGSIGVQGDGIQADELPPAPAIQTATRATVDEVESPLADPEPSPPAPRAPIPLSAPAEVEEMEQVQPVAIGDRIKSASKSGSVLGAGLGLFAVVISAPLLLDRLTTIGDPASPAIEVTALQATIAGGVAFALFGGLIAVVTGALGGFLSPDRALRGRPGLVALSGGFLGFVLGVVGMGLLSALSEEGLDGTVLLSVRSSVLALVLGGSVFGAMIAMATQVFGQPRALGELEQSSEEVRRRLSNAVFIPISAALVVLLFVIPLGSVLVKYPSFASVIAILVAGLILGFASLMASRPNMAVTRGEVLTAIAGVGIVVVLLALIAAQLAGPEEAEAGGESEASAIVRLG